MRERLFEFLELGGRSVDFKADELCHRQRLGKHRADVVQVLQERFRVDVAFAAEHFVAIDRELVEEIAGFILSLLSKFRQDRLQRRQLVRRNLEVRMKADESRKAVHAAIVAATSSCVEPAQRYN